MAPLPALLPLTEPTDLRESLTGSVVDRAAGVVRDVVLLGERSKHGYAYTDECRRQAVPLYEGAPVCLDHGENLKGRSVRDLAGFVMAPRLAPDGRIRGDVRIQPGPNAELAYSLFESSPPGVGMSHIAEGRKSRDGKLVESIGKVHRVDIVLNPATTTSFRESAPMPETQAPAADPQTVKLLEQANAALAVLNEKIAKLEADKHALEKRDKVRQLCEAASFKADAELVEALAGMDEAAAKVVIAGFVAKEKLIESLGVSQGKAKTPEKPAELDIKSFAAAIKS